MRREKRKDAKILGGVAKKLRVYASCLLTFCCLILSANADVNIIQGRVSFTVNSAREYIQDGLPENTKIPAKYYQFQAKNVEKAVTSYNNSGEVVGLTVQYINEPAKAYIYKKGHLAYYEIYDNPVNVYPHRGYRYDLDGNLVMTSLTVSKNELYRFSAEGELIAHSINGIIYDEAGKVIGTGK